MNKFIATVLLAVVCVSATAQDYLTREPTPAERQRVSGVAENLQHTFRRWNEVKVLGTNLSPVYTISSLTNRWEGTYLVAPTNAELAGAFTISLPNPTNNVNRTFRFIIPDGCHIVLSNNWGTGGAHGFRDMKTFGVSNVVWLVTSNKVASVYSTGTNYLVNVNSN